VPLHTFRLEVKSVSEGKFTGLASTYNNVDLAGDRVMPGAFMKTLASSSERPLYLEHKTPIGKVQLKDSPAGLLADGALTMQVQAAQDAYALLRDGVIKGLSIGYQVVRSDFVDGARQLQEVKLFEVSLTGIPCNEDALVTSVKSRPTDQVRAVLAEFRRDIVAALERK
jgi:HK97 family phage prohead protease